MTSTQIDHYNLDIKSVEKYCKLLKSSDKRERRNKGLLFVTKKGCIASYQTRTEIKFDPAMIINVSDNKYFTAVFPLEDVLKFIKGKKGNIKVWKEEDFSVLSYQDTILRFPKIYETPKDYNIEYDTVINVDASIFIDKLKRMTNTIHKDTDMISMCGVLLEVSRSGVTLVSTDAHAMTIHPVDNIDREFTDPKFSDPKFVGQYIIPTECINLLINYADKYDEINIYVDHKYTKFYFYNHVSIFTEPIFVNFPNYKAIGIKNVNTQFKINKNEIINILKHLSTYIDEYYSKPLERCVLCFYHNELIVLGITHYFDSGSTRTGTGFSIKDFRYGVFDSDTIIKRNGVKYFDKIPVKIEGREFFACYDVNKLRELLEQIKTDKVIFQLEEEYNTPLVLLPDDDSKEVRFLMPINLV